MSVGGGISYGVLLNQDILEEPGSVYPQGRIPSQSRGDYQRIAWLLDGGVSIEVDAKRAVLAGFRLQRDFDVFGGTGNAPVMRRYETYGFYGGLEVGF